MLPAAALVIAVLSAFAEPDMSTQNARTYQHAAVAADHPLASQAGAAMLRAGGNAVDAAVAASFTLSVVRPYSCGIGGGGFMVIRLPKSDRHPEGVCTTINYREWGIGAMREDSFEQGADVDAATHGGKAVCVPGTVAGLLYALEKYGTKSREEVLAPAIKIATEGFAVDAHYEESSHNDELVLPWLNADSARPKRFAFLWNRFLNKGEVRRGYVLVLPEQAKALKIIAERGADGFYKGEIAEAIVKTVRGDGGAMTLEDLAEYRVEERAALRSQFRGHEVIAMPPPSSGGIVFAQVLGMLDQRKVDLAAAVASGHGSAEYIHLVTEASKHAFADRARWMADPNFIKLPTRALLSEEYISNRAAAIRLDRTLEEAAYGSAEPPAEDGGTSHLCALDESGGAVACTETVNLIFGSLLCVEEFGFPLNNEMDDFVTRKGHANAFGLDHADRNRPGAKKRPLSSMTPTLIVKDGRVMLMAGGAGGPRIISGTIQAALNVLLFDMNADDAVSSARFHHQWRPNTLQLEPALFENAELVKNLRALGHDVTLRKVVASVQIIRRSKDAVQAGSDPRKGGTPAGY